MMSDPPPILCNTSVTSSQGAFFILSTSISRRSFVAMSFAEATLTEEDAAFGAYGEFVVNPLATAGVLGITHGEPAEPVLSVVGVGVTRAAPEDDGRTEDGRAGVGLADGPFLALRPRLCPFF